MSGETFQYSALMRDTYFFKNYWNAVKIGNSWT